MKIAVYAGTFDPFTYGHLSIARGAHALFDHVAIAIAINSKKKPLFSLSKRLLLIETYLAECAVNPCYFERPTMPSDPGISIQAFDGLLVQQARDIGACALIRGLRAVSDFDIEMGLADANRRQCSEVQTVFLPAAAHEAFVSSSFVKELASFADTNLNHYVNRATEDALRDALWTLT